MLISLPRQPTTIDTSTEKRMGRGKLKVEMTAKASSRSSASSATTSSLLTWWLAKLMFSLFSFIAHAMRDASTRLSAGFLPRLWKTRHAYTSAVSFARGSIKRGPREAQMPCPPLPCLATFFLSIGSFLTDAVRRPDGTVRRYLTRLDLKVGPDPNPVRGVCTADFPVDDTRGLWFRLFLPASQYCRPDHADGKLPVVVYFHGGGFAFLSPDSAVFDALCRRICREVGAAVVSVNYRLSPEHRWPAPYEDGVDVLRFLDSSSPCSGSGGFGRGSSSGNLLHRFFEVADLSSCFVAGDSAGGNIAHHVARRWTTANDAPQQRGRVRLAGLVAIQPFFGGEGRVESEIRLAGAPLVNTERTDWLWRAFLPEGASRDHEAANPAAGVAGVGEAFPPAMVVVGGFDPLQDWQRRYVKSLREMGKQARVVEYRNAVHAFCVIPGLGASVAPLLHEMRSFVQKRSAVANEDIHVRMKQNRPADDRLSTDVRELI